MPERQSLLAEFRSRLRGDAPDAAMERRRFWVGAAIGTGLAAQSAIRGGADLLLALSAGRIRCMGEPSIAAMLPLRESNALVMDFARSEILPRATVPVFFGASAFDPRLDLAKLVREIADAGFCGVTNFPTAALIDGTYRQFLEKEGLGFGRELELLETAKDQGLLTLAYTHTLDEARASAERRVDIVNIDLGWNMGGVVGVDTDLRIEEAGLRAHTIARAVRSISPQTRCLVEGGPIVNPQQLEELCQIARVDGYIGGSTIDRVPLESAVEVVTAAFKAIGTLDHHIQGLERTVDHRAFPRSLRGHSPAVDQARALFARVAATDYPVLIVGERGTGKREIARALHAASARRGRNLIALSCREPMAGRLKLDLFGCMAGADPSVVKHRLSWLEIGRGSTILLDEVEVLGRDIQRQLVEAAETGRFWRLGSERPLDLDVRFIAVADTDLAEAPSEDMDARFLDWISRFVIRMAPLRERIDDLPALVDETLTQIQARSIGRRRSLDPSVYRTLAGHSWTGNLRELTTVLERAVLVSPGEVIGPEHLPALVDGNGHPDPSSAFESEKDWLITALRRNRFRRGQTADFLGISRKTLYNKMRLHGLLPVVGKRAPQPPEEQRRERLKRPGRSAENFFQR